MRRSLQTDDRALARRRLTDLQRDLLHVNVQAGRLSLADLCDRHLATIANQSESTREQKTQIAKRIKGEWPGGAHISIGKVTPSTISRWLAGYQFGASNHNHHLLFLRAAFQMAVDDKLLAHLPVAVERLPGMGSGSFRWCPQTNRSPGPQKCEATSHAREILVCLPTTCGKLHSQEPGTGTR